MAWMSLDGLSAQFLPNPSLDRSRPYGSEERAVLSQERAEEAATAIRQWPSYAPTPLRRLAAMAREAGIAEVRYKDEGHRFGLKSFKALGGAYAVQRLAAERDARELTVACATDGNHGRAVAWGARNAGAKAVIFIHEGVSQERADAIARFGAEVVRAGRTYDDSVRICAKEARRNGWQIVSDTSWPGYEEVPKTVMQGYAVMAAEAEDQGARPTHVFVQGGVGGAAAAVLSWSWERRGAARPIFIVVEPEKAACLFESAGAGAPTSVGGDLDTIMAGLACGEPSPLAWRILGPGADAFMTIPDEAAAQTMRDLAALGVVGGESGVAGLAGFRLAARDGEMRRILRLDETSRVLLFGTEGATDPEVYQRIVGRPAEEVERVFPSLLAGQRASTRNHRSAKRGLRRF
jgi:diaminopropionate ammonia-lyase